MKMPLSASVKNFEPITVPEDKYFLLGDCRDNSYDSRFWGFVDRSDIVGRVEMVLWSKLAWKMTFPLPGRLFRKVI
jgi:signal peptidase I